MASSKLTLRGGEVCLSWPDRLHEHDIEIVEEWFALMLRVQRRQTEKPPHPSDYTSAKGAHFGLAPFREFPHTVRLAQCLRNQQIDTVEKLLAVPMDPNYVGQDAPIRWRNAGPKTLKLLREMQAFYAKRSA